MSFLDTAHLSRAPMAGLSVIGVFWGGFAAFIPDIKARVGASDAELGLTLMMMAVGGITAMWFGPRLFAPLGRYTLPVAALIAAVAVVYPLLAHSVPALGLALFGIGASLSLLDMGSNIRISILEERHGMHLMNVNHAMFSFSFAAMALLASLARRAGFAPADFFAVSIVVIVALAGAMVERGDWSGAPETPAGADHRGIWRAILPAAGILFMAFVAENATDSWSALHIERTLGQPAGDGGLGPMMLGLTMGFGRLSGQLLAAKLGEAGLIFWSSVVGVIGAVVTAAAQGAALAILGIGLIGLGVAVTVPSANSILGKLVRPDQRGYAISRAWMIGFTGFFVGPTMMGQIAQHLGLRAGFLGIAAVMALILPCVVLIRRVGR